MALNRMLQKLHSLLNGRLLRRATAMALAASMVLPMTSAFAFTAQNKPTVLVTEGDIKVEAPTINIELNAVVDAAGELTGELEIALWAKSGVVDGTLQPFNTLAVALQFSQALVPYDFSGKEVNLDNTEGFTVMTGMETLKKCNLLSTAGAMVSGIPAGEGGGGYLVLTASAHRPIELKEMTLLSVVTFKYDLASATTKPKATEVSAVNAWLAEQGKYLNENLNAPIKFAPAAVIDNSDGAAVERELTYSSSTNLMYWSDSSYKQDEQEDSKYVPKLAIEAVDTKGTTDTSDDTLSKLSNLMEVSTRYLDDSNKPRIVDHAINFTLVNKLTYDDSKMKNSVIIEFFDWDDTQIGAIAVPMDKDVREVVNKYVKEHFIHPDLWNADVTSLTRANTYRGKYPTTPSAEGAYDTYTDGHRGDDLVGADYPLTNKLDYVFFKRPMVRDDIDANKWTQMVDTEDSDKAAWDEEYPYIYGWAITDISTVNTGNSTWTTLGSRGELRDYSTSESLYGGYQDIGTAPAELTVSGEKFEFANFDFAAEGNGQKAGSVYAVKAVYELGKSLAGFNGSYRMVKKPYYNKANGASAAEGGVYTVAMAYERATTEFGVLQGVSRARSLYVRQDSTADVRWADEDLANASKSVANDRKTETIYVAVDVANAEIVDFTLYLSPRFNHIDYFLTDIYGLNVVIGNTRSQNNASHDHVRSGGNVVHAADGYDEFVLDNYNYNVPGDSETEDAYYDADFDERDGSLGYVLYGTLNSIMEHATIQARVKAENPTKDDPNFASYVYFGTMADANLHDASGVLAGTSNQDALRTKITQAAQAAEDEHKVGHNDWWNLEKNCAEFTYHQLQYYILKGSLLPDATEANIINEITWCNLHAACTTERANKPTDWESLIAAAKEGGNKIDQMTLAGTEKVAHLRRTTAGAEFRNVNEFKSALVGVLTGSGALASVADPTWEQVQSAILNQPLPGDVNDRVYWWYDGSTSMAIQSWDDLLDASQDALNRFRLPDNSKVTRQADLNVLETAYNDNKALTGDMTDSAWVAATENLCATDTAGKFDTFQDFKDALLAALERAYAAADDARKPESWQPTWYQIQYDILHNEEDGYEFPLVPSTLQETEFTSYYWHNGGRKVTDVTSMLWAAQQGSPEAIQAWNDFTFADLYNYAGLKFAKNFTGDEYSSGEFGAFKANIEAMVASAGTNRSWNQVQYYLIHKGGSDTGIVNGTTANAEGDYYWWHRTETENQTKGQTRFNAITSPSTGLATLLDASYRAQINKDPYAWYGLTTDKIKAARLIAGDNAANTWAGLNHFASVAGLTDDTTGAIRGLASAAGGKAAAPGQAIAMPGSTTAVTWHNLQYYLFNQSLTDPGTGNYWWETADSPDAVQSEADILDEFKNALQKVLTSGNYTDINTFLSDTDKVNKIFCLPGNTPFDDETLGYYINSGADIWGALTDYGVTDATSLSWYQVEWIMATQGFPEGLDDEAISGIFSDPDDGLGIDVPKWVLDLYSYVYTPYGAIIAAAPNGQGRLAATAAVGNATVIPNSPTTTPTVSANESDKDTYIRELEAKVAEQAQIISQQQALIDQQATYIVALESATPIEEPVEQQTVAGGYLVSAVNTVKTWAQILVAKAQDSYTTLKERSRTNRQTRLGQSWAELLEWTCSRIATNVTTSGPEPINLVVKTERRDTVMTTSLNNRMTSATTRLPARFSPGSSISLLDPDPPSGGVSNSFGEVVTAV